MTTKRFRKILKRGSRGDLVKTLQELLLAKGYKLSTDGVFGPGTEAQVKAFQKDKGLVADGIVGPKTLAILNQDISDQVLPIPNISIENLSLLFPSTPKPNLEAHAPNVLQAMLDQQLGDKTMVLMALATVRAESAGFVPIKEYRSKYNTPKGGAPYSLYDYRKSLGNLGPTDGADYCGRGFIQLTRRYNYTKYGERLGLDLLAEPELANESKVAAQVLSMFLQDKEQRIRRALARKDFKSARRAVNGGRHGLSAFTQCFKLGQKTLPDWD